MAHKLLLADDSITIQKVVGIIFANEDYELTVVDNGTAAVEKAREILPDLMLVDALMPGKNGYEVCSEVRGDSRLKNVPILLLTGVFEAFDEDKARESGADDFISKPFESQQLIDKVNRLIESAATRAAEAPAAGAEAAAASSLEQLESGWDISDNSTIFSESATGDEWTSAAVEVAPGDDLWGAVDEPVEEEITFADSTEEPKAPLQDDPFAFADLNDDSAAAPQVQAAVPASEPSVIAVEEDFGVFPAEEPVSVFDTADAQEQVFAPEEEYVPVPDAITPSLSYESAPEDAFAAAEMDSFGLSEAEEFAAAVSGQPFTAPEPPPFSAPEPVTAAPAAPATEGTPASPMSEDQIKAVIASLSREVIERIVWEVVPDLAEALIKEEIRKIKEGA